MTDQSIEITDESRISRRNALKVAVGAGVGAVAWTGPQITSFGATPAYAAGCTGFTLNVAFTDLSTNQSSGCDTFSYNNSPDLDNKIPTEYNSGLPGGGNFHCADENTATSGCYTFTFPSDEYCQIEIKVAENGDGLTGPYYGEVSVEGTGGSIEYCLPEAPFANTISGSPYTVNPNTRWNVFLQCVKAGDQDKIDDCAPVEV